MFCFVFSPKKSIAYVRFISEIQCSQFRTSPHICKMLLVVPVRLLSHFTVKFLNVRNVWYLLYMYLIFWLISLKKIKQLTTISVGQLFAICSFLEWANYQKWKSTNYLLSSVLCTCTGKGVQTGRWKWSSSITWEEVNAHSFLIYMKNSWGFLLKAWYNTCFQF